MDETKMVLLTKYIPSDKNANQKAPEDIENIFKKNFGNVYRIYYTNRRVVRNIDLIRNYLKLKWLKNKKNIVLFVQWPLYSKKPFQDDFVFRLRFKKTVAVIHDIDSLRFFPNDSERIKKDIEIFNKFNIIICHNSNMKNWLKNNGVKTSIINIKLFDYLGENFQNIIHEKDYRIIFAGNLDKSIFLKNIDTVLCKRILIYGSLPKYALPKNIIYKGSYSPNELRKKIEGEFGLIWDGESSESCIGENGNYMKFNNPHKLSLYISCGLPVIVWSKAAIADFIVTHKIGIIVNDLKQIDFILDSINNEQYQEYLNNVKKLKTQILNGEYTKNVIRKVMHLL